MSELEKFFHNFKKLRIMHVVVLSIMFCIGYGLIMYEHKLKLDKSIPAVITGMLMWGYLAMSGSPIPEGLTLDEAAMHHAGNIAGIIFFLIGAMTIVNAMLERGSFELVKQLIRTEKQIRLMWITTGVTFFLSAVLDNLTTTIVMIAILSKIVQTRRDLLTFGVLVVIAANAGGAWSPIGDLTTTILWIDGKVTPLHLVKFVLLPSVVQASFIPLLFTLFPEKLTALTHGIVEMTGKEKEKGEATDHDGKRFMLVFGLAALLFVPIFKTVTHLPPWMGMIFSAGMVLAANEYFNRHARRRKKTTILYNQLLASIEWSAILFFLGILIAVSAFETVQIGNMSALSSFALSLSAIMPLGVFGILLGIVSAIIDNIPLVFAIKSMFDMPQDHWFWHFISYTAGTGGSILIIGSAAGVVAMSLLKIEFFWYVKKFSLLILLSYLAGAGVFVLQRLM